MFVSIGTKIRKNLKANPQKQLRTTAAFVLLGLDAKRRSTTVTLFSLLSQLDF